MDDPGSNGTVGNGSAGDEDDAGEFAAVDLNLEAKGTTNVMLSPVCRTRDRSAVDDQQRKSDVDKVPRQQQL